MGPEIPPKIGNCQNNQAGSLVLKLFMSSGINLCYCPKRIETSAIIRIRMRSDRREISYYYTRIFHFCYCPRLSPNIIIPLPIPELPPVCL